MTAAARLILRFAVARRLAAAVALCVAFVFVGAQSAYAASAPAYYSHVGAACTAIVDGSYSNYSVQTDRPYAVTDYNGTASLLWYEHVQYLTTSGTWADLPGNFNAITSSSWSRGGSTLTPIYWGNTYPNGNASVAVKHGYDYQVVGITAWVNNANKVIAATSTPLVGCDFRR